MERQFYLNRHGETEAKLLNKNLVVLRAELRTTHVATLAKLSQEWRRRSEKNAEIRERLSTNPYWKASAGNLRIEQVLRPSMGRLQELCGWIRDAVATDVGADTLIRRARPSKRRIASSLAEKH